jgi:caffeoyl-CoA O-methyltransferase
MDFIDSRISEYCAEHTRAENDLMKRLASETYAKTTAPQMQTGNVEGQFLKMLVQMTGAKRIIEVGMFTGYSALSMAAGLPDDGELFTCEISEEFRKFAQRFFDESPHGKKIKVLLGMAGESIAKLSGIFDLAFIDADKEGYCDYYQKILPKLRPGGIMAFDNALWSGAVLSPQNETDRAIDALNKLATDDPRVENVLLSVRDGIQLVRKIG